MQKHLKALIATLLVTACLVFPFYPEGGFAKPKKNYIPGPTPTPKKLSVITPKTG